MNPFGMTVGNYGDDIQDRAIDIDHVFAKFDRGEAKRPKHEIGRSDSGCFVVEVRRKRRLPGADRG